MYTREIDDAGLGGGRDPAPDSFRQARALPHFVSRFRYLAALVFAAFALVPGCRQAVDPPPAPGSVFASQASPPVGGTSDASGSSAPRSLSGFDAQQEAMLEDLEHRTFGFFWDLANPQNGLVPDRAPSPSFSSIAAVGFGLTAYPIGVERGYITREAARQRVLTTLRFFALPSGGAAGAHGFFYHFLDMKTGARFKDVELSTIDTSELLAGALFCQSWFDRDDPAEAEIRALADQLYRAADWTYWLHHPPLVSMGWTAEEGFNEYDWRGYNEGMILYVLALGSPTHPVPASAWDAYTSTYKWGRWEGEEHVAFAPLFGHEQSHLWIDFRGIRDAYMRGKGIDYFENTRRAVYAQRSYAIHNPGGWRGYGADMWGISACDGPIDGDFDVEGRKRHFYTYAARGASMVEVRDDGTLAPMASASALPFAPEIALPAIAAMQSRFGELLWARYGFLDAFNPTLRVAIPVQHGKVVPGVGWFDIDYLGIDQGSILGMVENARSGLIWKTMRRNPYVVSGLRRAGFTGGWLDAVSR